MIADLEEELGRSIPLTEIAKATGINRVTLSKIYHRNDYNATVNVLDKLCGFFDCKVGDLIEYMPDSETLIVRSQRPRHN
jgi:putative transcriptional regulator